MTKYLYLAAALAGAAMLAGLYWLGHSSGADSVRAKWDREKAAQVIAAENDRIIKEEGIANVSSTFAAKAQKARVITQTIIQEIDRYVPITDPMLSGGFRLLHDAAAAGQALDHSSRINAAPVASATVAKTVAGNYADCRYDKERLEALQAIMSVIVDAP